MDKQKVIFKDLGLIDYKEAWDYQENLLAENVGVKSRLRQLEAVPAGSGEQEAFPGDLDTRHYLLFCEHPPVYTLGKSGNAGNLLINESQMQEKQLQFFNSNRGGDITFHGPGQVVGYPILDLERYYTDIGKYLRNLEEVIIRAIGEYGIDGGRSSGETGVWIDTGVPGRERKIAAIGVRCSRWVTMHGFALNVNTDLSYFNNIIPCGIVNKQVTSIEKELGRKIDFESVKSLLKQKFEEVFESELV